MAVLPLQMQQSNLREKVPCFAAETNNLLSFYFRILINDLSDQTLSWITGDKNLSNRIDTLKILHVLPCPSGFFSTNCKGKKK